MNFRTYADLNNTIIENLHRIPNDVDLIVGIPRSGMVPAAMIALYLNITLTDIDKFAGGGLAYTKGRTKPNKEITQFKKALVVDDSINSGKSINEVKNKLHGNDIEVLFCAIYVTPGCEKDIDIAFEIVEYPRMFEWNYLHHPMLSHACFDIDGVLCNDPVSWQNDHGVNYRKFLCNAYEKLHPTQTIGYIITSRKDTYKEETIKWLQDKEVKYGQIIMQPVNEYSAGSNEEHAQFKARHYKELEDTFIFIESNDEQARIIAKETGKAVYCVDSQNFYGCNQRTYKRNRSKYAEPYLIRRIKNMLKRVLRKV